MKYTCTYCQQIVDFGDLSHIARCEVEHAAEIEETERRMLLAASREGAKIVDSSQALEEEKNDGN